MAEGLCHIGVFPIFPTRCSPVLAIGGNRLHKSFLTGDRGFESASLQRESVANRTFGAHPPGGRAAKREPNAVQRQLIFTGGFSRDYKRALHLWGESSE